MLISWCECEPNTGYVIPTVTDLRLLNEITDSLRYVSLCPACFHIGTAPCVPREFPSAWKLRRVTDSPWPLTRLAEKFEWQFLQLKCALGRFRGPLLSDIAACQKSRFGSLLINGQWSRTLRKKTAAARSTRIFEGTESFSNELFCELGQHRGEWSGK